MIVALLLGGSVGSPSRLDFVAAHMNLKRVLFRRPVMCGVAFVLQSLGLEAVLHFSCLIPLLLEMAKSRHKEIRLCTLAAFGSLVQATWPRIKHHILPICSVLSEVHTSLLPCVSVCQFNKPSALTGFFESSVGILVVDCLIGVTLIFLLQALGMAVGASHTVRNCHNEPIIVRKH